MRVIALDQRVQQVKNQHTNPSFDKASIASTAERWRNLATNPRATTFTVANGTFGWRNSRWAGSGGTVVYSLVTGAVDGPDGITSYARKTWTVAPSTVGNTGFDHAPNTTSTGTFTNNPTVTPGVYYTVSAYLRSSVDVTDLVRNRVFWRDAAGNHISNVLSASTTLVAGQWKRISNTFLAPAGAVSMAAVTDVDGGVAWAPGNTLDGTGLMITATPYLVPYFDGITTATSVFGLDHTSAWVGTANASQSTITAPTTNVAVITNQCWNPSFENATLSYWNPWAGGGGTPAVFSSARTATTAIKGVHTHRGTVTTANTSGATASMLVSSSPDLAAGQACNASIYVRSNRAITITPSIDWYIKASTTFVSTTVGTPVVVAANTWVRVSVQGTAPATATTGRLAITSNSIAWVLSDWIEMDACLFTYTSGILPYFDGSGVLAGEAWADSDFSTVWNGTTDLSQSQLRTVSPLASVAAGGIWSSQWSNSGVRSLRVVPRGVSNDSYVAIGGDTGALRLGMQAGKTYTVLVTIRLSAPLTGSLSAFSRRIILYTRIGAGSYVSQASTQVANTAGVTQIRMFFTVPVGATEALIRLYNGADVGGGHVWWDDFMLVEGRYSGPYIDPNSAKAKWLGTQYASESVGYPSL